MRPDAQLLIVHVLLFDVFMAYKKLFVAKPLISTET